MKKFILIAGIFFALISQSFGQEYGTWYISGIAPFKLIPDGNSYKVMWSTDDWISDERESDSTTSTLIFDKDEDEKQIYYEYEPGNSEFRGKFIFDDKDMDSGTYIKNDGFETRFSKASFQKDY
jgi:hypothetical protein